ncbi:MAG: SDR family oxidoreductase [Bacteroidetes bacterium]|nr:SDR family oxidoreductase [Bacteroidota bacterium]
MKSFMQKAVLAAAAYGSAKALYQYIKEKQYSFEYKVVLITGGSRGLGLVMARQLAKEGAYLSICASDKEELNIARQQLEDLDAPVLAIQADLTIPGEAERVIEQTVAQYGRLEVLINNAGHIVVGPLSSHTQQHFHDLMELHFFAPLRLIDSAIPYLKQTKGRILNISSIGGKISAPHLAAYSASKFALTGFSEGLYPELKPQGITVTTACPGLMRTGSPRNVEVVGNYEKEYRWFKISDSLPFLAMHSEKAAKKLLNACRRGDPEYIMTIPARILSLLHGLSPSMVIRMNSLFKRMILPNSVTNTHAVRGYETHFEYNRGPVTKLTDKAARRNNEYH